jgi:hypothetical protein
VVGAGGFRADRVAEYDLRYVTIALGSVSYAVRENCCPSVERRRGLAYVFVVSLLLIGGYCRVMAQPPDDGHAPESVDAATRI